MYLRNFLICIWILISSFSLFGDEEIFAKFDSDLGRIEYVEIKKGSPSLSDTFLNSQPKPTSKVVVEVDAKRHPSVVSDESLNTSQPPLPKAPTVQLAIPERKSDQTNAQPESTASQIKYDQPEEKAVTTAAWLENVEVSQQGLLAYSDKSTPKDDAEKVILTPQEQIVSTEQDAQTVALETPTASSAVPTLDKDKSTAVSDTQTANPDASSVDSDTTTDDSIVPTADPDALPFLTSDFFADSLAGASVEQDPMGTQRLLEENGRFSPSLGTSTNISQTSNRAYPNFGASTNLSLTFNAGLGLGEYPIGDYLICTPAASIMQSINYSDIAKYNGVEMRKGMNGNSFVASVSAPLLLPNEFTLSLAHTYMSARDRNEELAYMNVPAIQLQKQVATDSGNMLILVAGFSYTFSTADSGLDMLKKTSLSNSLGILEALGGAMSGQSLASTSPDDVGSKYTFTFSASYMIPFSEKFSISPSITYNIDSFTKGSMDGRVDKTLFLGINASYLWTDWLSLSLMANYSSISGNRTESPNYDDLLLGAGINVNHAF